jgi:hypothetical protein
MNHFQDIVREATLIVMALFFLGTIIHGTAKAISFIVARIKETPKAKTARKKAQAIKDSNFEYKWS